MAITTVDLTMEGYTPLLMHNDALVDPLSEATKAFKRITAKRVKTDADHEEMARREFRAGLYLDDDGAPVIPAVNVIMCLIEGGKITRSGRKVERGVTSGAFQHALLYDGPPDAEGLWADPRFVSRLSVVVGTSRLIRVRPQFKKWRCVAELLIDDLIISAEELEHVAANAGAMVGLMDYRKAGGYGRFHAKLSA